MIQVTQLTAILNQQEEILNTDDLGRNASAKNDVKFAVM